MDLRIPSGVFFTAVGVILCATGLFLPQLAAPLAGSEVNTGSGIMMLAFGASMLLWAKVKP